MPTVADILRRKGTGVVTVAPEASVLDAARLMNAHRIGSVVVAAGQERTEILGIFTERDILTRVVGAERDPRTTRVRDVMTSPVLDCGPNADVNELRTTMQQRRIRHMPVRDGTLCGMVSIGDLNALQAESLSVTVQALEGYITRP